ncbi:putative membrane protein, partial [Chlamydia psittaci 84-8471/1]
YFNVGCFYRWNE